MNRRCLRSASTPHTFRLPVLAAALALALALGHLPALVLPALAPAPSSEVASLLARLHSVSKGQLDPADYWADGEWDMAGLQDDLDIQRAQFSDMDEPQEASLSIFEDILASEWLSGTVLAATSAGLLVDVNPPGGGPSSQGLVQVGQYEQNARIHMGQQVHVRVASLDVASGFLVLSMKGDAESLRLDLQAQLQAWRERADSLAASSHAVVEDEEVPDGSGFMPDQQDVTTFESIPSTHWLLGIVRHVATFGAYIDVEPPLAQTALVASGLVQTSELAEGIALADLKPGANVWVRVLRVDKSSGRLALSMRRE